ncbi:MAG TPA: Asp-tRNA(Asn)/Glu-tRNA(Gln) amidotransferase subunit GatA [Clostridiaceae bacterium]|nr:Asp-tRNA(Asn)/Glu-tRNA(Gln) amidotransferase subunit GatA [Clostridiaceae bacterium]
MEIHEYTAHELSKMLKNKEIKVKELTESVLNRIDNIDKELGSFITICREEALKKSVEVQHKIDNRQATSPLAGIPMLLSDNICTREILTTCSSKMLHNFVPPYGATVANKLDSQGSVLIGKGNIDEFGIGGTTETSYYKTTKNPWNLEKLAGGSCGGAASAVASGEVVFSLGSDTGGSIRQPSSFCGVVGMKPTYGAVSRFGVIPFASSFDQVGPVTKDVEDCALVLNAITGHDPLDSTSVNKDYPDFTKALEQDIKGLKIGIPKEWVETKIDPDVKKSFYDSVKVLEELGAVCEYFSFSLTDYIAPTYYILTSAEVSSNLARFDGIKYGYRAEKFSDLQELYKKTRAEGFGEEAKRRILLGTYVLSSGCYEKYFKKALKVRTMICEEFNKAFDKYNLIISPTTPRTAYSLGEMNKDFLSMCQDDVYTASANIAGLPAISIPCGFGSNNIPFGLQFIGKQFDDFTLIKAAYNFEQNTEYHKKRPSL